jgi:hypothetical protein
MSKKKHRVENKPYMRAMQELRKSSAAQPHKLKKNKGTRKARDLRAIRESLDSILDKVYLF